MGWTVSKDANAAGTFEYELWDGFDTIHRVGGFATPQDADKAGGRANTNYLLYGAIDPARSLDDILSELDADQLLAELLA